MLPDHIRDAVEAVLGTSIQAVVPTSGGSINQAARVETADDVAFLKWHRTPPSGMFAAEADGLRRIATTKTVRVPTVLAVDETWLLLEWLPVTNHADDRTAAALGRQLAALHRHTADAYGLERDNYIGSTPQHNDRCDDWVTFWRERRLVPQRALAARQGRLPERRRRLLDRCIDRLDGWLSHEPPASLVHGDLWGGNWVVLEDGRPALIDPAVYHGDRETDLAFARLFGGFPATFYDAYEESWPLAEGAAVRRDLYNLYHLLNHLNLFGGSYEASVDRVLEHYAG